MAPTKLDAAVAVLSEKRSLLAAQRGKRDELTRALEQVTADADAARKALGRAIADGSNVDAAKAELRVRLVEIEGLEAACAEVSGRIKRSVEAVRNAERDAGRCEIQKHVEAAERLKAETLRLAALFAESHGRWHSLARRCAEVAAILGEPGAQPVRFDGVFGSLSNAHDDGEGLVGVLRKYGVSATFGAAIRERLPRVDGLVRFEGVEEEDDEPELDDERGITAERYDELDADGV